MTKPFANPVGFLQEFCQKYNTAKFPLYTQIGSIGPDHSKEFSYKCTFDGFEVVSHSGQKQQAKVNSASAMIELLVKNDYFKKFDIDIENKGTFDTENKGTLSATNNGALSNGNDVGPKNPISALQEYCQTKKMNLPSYLDSSSPGTGFVYTCILNMEKTHGYGSNKKLAKTKAAIKMCEKLNITFGNESDFESEEELVQKNSISALNELCASRMMPKPEYCEKKSFSNLFTVVCMVGSVSAEGSDTNKKGAKVLAANKVLKKFKSGDNHYVNQPLKSFSSNKTVLPEHVAQSSSSVLKEFNLDSDGAHSSSSVLEEFNLDSGDEDETANTSKGDTSKTGVKVSGVSDLVNNIESLNHDDSGVEVEPSSVNIKSQLVLNPSELDSDENVTNISFQLTGNKNEGLQGPKVTLTDALDQPSEHLPKSPFSFQVSNLEDKKSNKSKPAVSESLVQWAQRTS